MTIFDVIVSVYTLCVVLLLLACLPSYLPWPGLSASTPTYSTISIIWTYVCVRDVRVPLPRKNQAQSSRCLSPARTNINHCQFYLLCWKKKTKKQNLHSLMLLMFYSNSVRSEIGRWPRVWRAQLHTDAQSSEFNSAADRLNSRTLNLHFYLSWLLHFPSHLGILSLLCAVFITICHNTHWHIRKLFSVMNIIDLRAHSQSSLAFCRIVWFSALYHFFVYFSVVRFSLNLMWDDISWRFACDGCIFFGSMHIFVGKEFQQQSYFDGSHR